MVEMGRDKKVTMGKKGVYSTKFCLVLELGGRERRAAAEVVCHRARMSLGDWPSRMKGEVRLSN